MVACSTWRRLRNAFRKLGIPGLLAFALLVFQVAIPWSVTWFATQDGPSHLYNAVVARELVLHHRHTPFASVYQINRRIVPNWAGTFLLGGIEAIVGADHAEKVMVSLLLCTGFFAFAFAVRSFAPKASPWTPLANFLVQSWFLWIGFFNFYLSMLLALVAAGFYVRGECRLSPRRTCVLAAGLLGVFFTQLIGAAIALLTIGCIAFWVHVVVPGVMRPRGPVRWKQLIPVAASMLPVLLLTSTFAFTSSEGGSGTGWLNALLAFPLHVFATAPGANGAQYYLWPAALSYMVASVFVLTRGEWRSPRGGLVLAMLGTFGLYLLVPDKGLGGDLVKLRFAWGVFLLGGLLVASAHRMRRFQLPLALYVAVFLTANLVATAQSVADSSDMIGDYLAQAGTPPRGARLIRLRYQTPDLGAKYGIGGLGRDPVFHLDGLIAARCRCIDLTDYEAPSEVFPVVFKTNVERGLQFALWGMEGPGAETSAQLDWLRARLPVPIDYALVVANASSPAVGRDQVIANLTGAGMRLVSLPGKDAFVAAYKKP